MSKKILQIVTNHSDLGSTGKKTGAWLEEVAAPYYEFMDAGFDVDIASPKGGSAAIDPKSKDKDSQTDDTKRFEKDFAANKKLNKTLALSDVDFEQYDAVFFSGGHGTMWDFVDEPSVTKTVESFLNDGKPTASVCHGPACLMGAKDKSGRSVVEGRSVTAFSNMEEDVVELTEAMPFLLETGLRDLGAKFVNTAPFIAHIQIDGCLITGQNPASSAPAARAVIKMLMAEEKLAA